MECTNEAYTIQPDFIQACQLANTPPTRRQASRFRSGKGRAYNVARIIGKAPPNPSWFRPVIESCPEEIKPVTPSPLPEDATEDQVKLAEAEAVKQVSDIRQRNVEIAAWRTRYYNLAKEQWPKAWALKTLGI